MDWITDDIAIGNVREALDAQQALAAGLRSAVSLNGALEEADPAALPYDSIRTVRLIDGPGNDPRLFERAIEALAECCRDHPPVLVHCHHGRSRSAVVVAAYLMRTERLGCEEALARVRSRREIAPSPAMLRLLSELQPPEVMGDAGRRPRE